MVVRKIIDLRLSPQAQRILQEAHLRMAKFDQERRAQNATKLAGIMALHHVRRAFTLDEKTNLHHWPEGRREELRKFRARVESDLKRIAGD